MKKKILSLALSMLMVLAMLPATAFAATSISDNIDEPALEKAAIAALGKEDDPDYVLTDEDAATIESLTVTGLKYGSLRGLESFTGLKTLTVTDSKVQDLSFLQGLSSLETVDLSNNNIEDLSGLSGLTNITSLNLSGNKIQDLSKLANLTSLTSLNLSNNLIEDADLDSISAMSTITDLDLSNNKIEDLAKLSGLTNLTKLNLSSNAIQDLDDIKGLASLTDLNLSYNKIEDISFLSNLSNLTTLDLTNNSVSDSAYDNFLPANFKSQSGYENWKKEQMATQLNHNHNYGEWVSDETNHWKECSLCGNMTDISNHTYKWVIDKEATSTEKGSKHQECSVCGYKLAAVEIPVIDDSIGTSDNENVDKVDDNKTQTLAPKTSDENNVVLWVAMLCVGLVGFGGIVIYNKKRSCK